MQKMNHDNILTSEEAEIIRHFATTRDKREEAIQIFYCHIAEHVKRDRNKCPEMEFMSEILSPCPDLGYRAQLRRRIIEAGDAG